MHFPRHIFTYLYIFFFLLHISPHLKILLFTRIPSFMNFPFYVFPDLCIFLLYTFPEPRIFRRSFVLFFPFLIDYIDSAFHVFSNFCFTIMNFFPPFHGLRVVELIESNHSRS